ncbi:MAG TPA: YafY family transcriptional regulator [Dietzia timorensis]|uniref:YafY family transcriptional regulator n=1 Tax=Dietzia timorensis TaxID=499555 RepID=A0A921JXI4_9ACTN|nr:YafY family protein [Dietzia timorensis]HJE90002.1 YafY family transcriptional regulator [Dietzia timorensis]
MTDSVATTERLLALLDMLGRRTMWTGAELGDELGITERTVRRDVERLRSLGYRIESAQGAGGGYRLGIGRRLPPLLLNDGEAVQLAVALRTAVSASSDTSGGAAERSDDALSALAKLEQHMPSRLREQVAGIVRGSVALDSARRAPDADVLLGFSRAIRDTLLVGFAYVNGQGVASARRAEPYRLVASAGRWYVQCFDLDREGWRSFRVDRITELKASGRRFTPRPEIPAPQEAIGAARPALTWPVAVRLRIAAAPEEVQRLAGGTYTEVEPDADRPGHALFRTSGSDVETIAFHLASFPWEFEVLSPPELRPALAAVAKRLAASAERNRP